MRLIYICKHYKNMETKWDGPTEKKIGTKNSTPIVLLEKTKLTKATIYRDRFPSAKRC